MNQSEEVLQLQVDVFCRDVAAAVEVWLEEVVKGNAELEGRFVTLLEIHDSNLGIRF